MTSPPRHGGNLRWAAALVGCDPAEILDFSASINPLGLPASVRVALAQSWQALEHYPDPRCELLSQALSQLHQVPSDWILVGNGAAELLTWIARTLETRQPVGLIRPAFADYERALSSFGIRPVALPLSLEQIRCDSEPMPLQVPPGLGSILINNPHNPTGILWPRETILQAISGDPQRIWVIDEAFMDFLPPSKEQSLIPDIFSQPNLIILRSLTKFYAMPGLRIGYVVAPPELIQQWQQWRDPWSVNSFAQIAARVALGDMDFQAKTWAWLATTRQELETGLGQLPGFTPFPSQANFLLVHYSGSVQQLQETLLRRARILIRDCLSFPELGNHYFRVAVRTALDNQRLLAALGNAVAIQEA